MSHVNPDGPCPCDIALFGEMPGYEEQIEGRGFVGKSGKQLWSELKRHTGLTRPQVYVSNLVKDGKARNTPPTPAEIAAALPEFLDELARVKPRIVITAGAASTRAVLGNVKMADVHGIPHKADIAGRQFLCHPIYHPAAGLHNKGFLAAFAYDLERLSGLLRGQETPLEATSDATTSWIDSTPAAATTALRSPVIALDTEGWIEQPWGLSFSDDGQHGYVVRADDLGVLRAIGRRLQGKILVLHNGIHDLPVLRRMGIPIVAFHDTQVLAYHDILRTGSGILEAESQNLGTLAYRECGLLLGELTDLPGVDLPGRVIPYTDAVRQYAGEDAVATYRLFRIYEQRGLLNYAPYQIDMGQIPLVEQMIRTGIPFEIDDTTEYYMSVLDKLAACTAALRQRAARLGNRDFNPGSHPQVRELLTRRIGLRIRKRTKGGLASTNERALADHQDDPFVQQIQAYRELIKLKGTYLVPLLSELLT